MWRGWAPVETAGDYERHYRSEVAEHLRQANGFCGAQLLRSDHGGEVLFTSITYFTDIDAVRSFAGDNYALAVVEEAARDALDRWDEKVVHHEVVVELDGG